MIITKVISAFKMDGFLNQMTVHLDYYNCMNINTLTIN